MIEVACSRAIETPPDAYESMEWDADGEPFFPPGIASVNEAAMRGRIAARRARRSTNGYSDERHRRVAEIYEANGKFPTKAVGEALGLAKSTAQLYVKKARERGFITAKPPRGGRP